VRPEGLSESIGNQMRDLPAYSAAPEPSTLLRAKSIRTASLAGGAAYSFTLNMEAAGCSETSVYFYQTTQRHIADDIRCNRQ
jgi:hypothetical protein